MPRQRKEFRRRTGLRDSSLVVIATEGEKTEGKYFKGLIAEERFHTNRFHLEILPSKDGKSAPKYVIEALDDFKREYRIREDDQLWIIIDRDFRSWSVKQLANAKQLCKQKGFYFGISNPCFEIWIILHFADISSLSDLEKEEIRNNAKQGSRTKCDQMILEELGHYNKSNPGFGSLFPKLDDAIRNAKILTNNNTVDLFNHIGTNIFVLVEGLALA
ncbi:MAG: RloB family protein [Bacteroidota bacterium]